MWSASGGRPDGGACLACSPNDRKRKGEIVVEVRKEMMTATRSVGFGGALPVD